jgi:hypothetical protein
MPRFTFSCNRRSTVRILTQPICPSRFASSRGPYGAQPARERSLTSDLSLLASAYFLSLGLPTEKAAELHKKYYSEYGLAIRGLVKHHEIGESLSRASDAVLLELSIGLRFGLTDALDYDRVCDAALPLEDILSYNPELRKLLLDIDPTKARILGTRLPRLASS